MHVFAGASTNGGGAGGVLDGLATEQGMYATIAYKRLLTGKTVLYDMSDVTLTPGGAPSAPSSSGKDNSNSSTSDGGASSKTVKVTKLTLNYSKLPLKKGKSQTLKVTVKPNNASNKGVKWTSSNKKVATVTQKGLVKAIKAGTAKITVTAKDGSKKKAVCTVTVKKASSGSSKKSSSGSGNKGTQSSGSNQTNRNQSNSNNQTNSNTSTNRQNTSNSQQTTQRNPSYNTSNGPAGNSNQSSNTGQSAGGTAGKNGSGNGSEEASTQTEAWTFDGDDYIPESAGDSFAEESTEGMDLEEYSTEEENGDNEDDKGVVDKKSTRVPVWLVVLMALLGAGAVTVAMKVPWMNLRDKLLLLILSRRKKK
jgi:cobalamin biosynthesis Mg chelatase CobN